MPHADRGIRTQGRRRAQVQRPRRMRSTGPRVLETSRVKQTGPIADGIAAGKDAGAELKKQAPAEFFANLIEHGGSW